jgi:threonylcarbamoyladenosine tRNA methylthiotransferase MtaB
MCGCAACERPTHNGRQDEVRRTLKRTIAFKSFGCRTNQEELHSLHSRLEALGCTVSDSPDGADVLIINSCCVTALTESKNRRYIDAVRRACPDIRILVTGCLAQQSPDALMKELGVWCVVGNTFKDAIPQLLEAGKGGVVHAPLDTVPPSLNPHAAVPVDPRSAPRTRYSLKIQEGCNFRCAYCIVPFVRGKSRSAALNQLMDTASAAVAKGYREIVLAGTHIGQYADSSGAALIDLLQRLVSIPGDFRIRLSSLDARDITPAILDLICGTPKICDHLHLSIQSLSGPVLQAMNRPHRTLDEFIGLLCRLRSRYPHFGLGGDFICGFPAETRQMFEETVQWVRTIGFSHGHVFRYSKRPHTAATTMPGQVPEPEKSRRSALLRDTLQELRTDFLRKMVGREFRILVETEAPPCGLTSNYIRATVPAAKAARNSWLNVTITGSDPVSGEARAEPAG